MKTLLFKTALFLLLLLPLFDLVPIAFSRPLISDGVDEKGFSSWNPITLKNGVSSNHGEETCEELYGFLPCAKTVPGHLFLILIYEYLLFHAESYLESGGERIFKILGPGVFGASAFQVIGSLSESLILLASGLSSNNEIAQECVVTGVGLLAGSSILLLTVIWGTCIFLGSQPFPSNLHSHVTSENPRYTSLERFLFSLWPSSGVMTNVGTSYTSRIMLISAFPLLVIQIPGLFNLSYTGERVFLVVTLVLSLVFLICYFFYQFFEPWIQRRRLLYIKHEHLVIDVLKHIQDQTMGKLLTNNGSPNVSAIRKLFVAKDNDGDKAITFSELRQFMEEIKFRQEQAQTNKDETAAQIMKEFDIDNDDKITLEEFTNGMSKWLDDTKDAMNKRYHSVKSLKDLDKILRPWLQKKREEREMMRHLMPVILSHLQNSIYGGLLAEDGTVDVEAIKRLFKDIDLDGDNCISLSELKQLITNIEFGILSYDSDIAASKIMEELDINRDHFINEEEFVFGLSKWLSITKNQCSNSDDSEEEKAYQKTWEQTDKLVEHKLIDKSPLAWAKAIALLVLGVVMLGVLAEPLIQSVRRLSTAADVPTFYISFVFIPLATTARLAVSAIKEARKKKLHTTSLTLSEIYGTVFMNNVLGLVVLLSLVYFRGLSWDFTVEVLAVLVVSAVIGCISSFNRVFPVWTSFLACIMYPLSLVFVYVLGGSKWLS